MRPRTLALAACYLLVQALAGRLAAAETHHFEDASLHAVQFVGDGEGWAVGDEGVIWHTIDSGKNWEIQRSGVTASLRSIAFVNPYLGWVVGREELPGGGSAGVLLFTTDAGLKWQRALVNTLPGLNVVRFVDEQIGYLAGDGSEHHPSGAYFTEDSGQHWKPIPGPRCSSWFACGIAEQCNAVLGGAWNRLAAALPDRVTALDTRLQGERNLRGIHFVGRRGVAVGQGGLVLVCDHPAGNGPWPSFPLPLEYQTNLDFHAVHGVGSHFWVVGRPGSVVLHSKDGGQHWELFQTHQPMPLNGVFFVDERTGWAVGELGTILATVDGGKTWRVQKRGGERSAALFIHARSGGVPLDAVARLGAQDGYLTAALRVVAPDGAASSPAKASEGLRFHAAVRQAGGVAGEMLWHFPLGSHLARASQKDLIQHWDEILGDGSENHLLRQLVLALRMWRPSLIVTDRPDEKSDDAGVESLLAETVRVAVERAGDPKAFPEQVNNLGLSPWKPAKVYALCEDPKTAQVRLDTTEACPVLEGSVREFVGPAFTLLEARASAPLERCFRYLVDGPPGHVQLMQGIDLAYSGPARRPMPQIEEMTPEQKKAVQQRLHLRAISETPSGLANPEQLLASLKPMVADLPVDQGAPALSGVALQYIRMGQWSLAREAYLLMLDRFPAHPKSAEAYRWLLQHNSSSEARRRHEMGQFLVVGQHSFDAMEVPTPPEQGVPASRGRQLPESFAGLGQQLKTPGANAPGSPRPNQQLQLPRIEERKLQQAAYLSNQAETRQWYQSCLDLESKLAAFGPLFTTDPAIQFCLQSARRNLGDFETPRKFYAQLASQPADSPWKRAAQAELWLIDRRGQPPREVVCCQTVEARPHLDGKLDDPCWQRAQPIKLSDAGGKTQEQYPTEVRLAFDREYLYVGVRCFHPAGQTKPPRKPRLHDVDLRDQDRVSLVFDLDRDYATCFHLQVDQRGCLVDDCWGDRTWDPRWFVGLNTEACCWTVELAIPLTGLTGDLVVPGRVWAFNAIRVVPGQGVQASAQPAEAPEETLHTEGLGLLLFLADQKQTAAAEPLPRLMPKVR